MIEQVVLVALVIGITQIIKETGKVSKQYLPIIAIIIAVMFNLLSGFAGSAIVIDGIIAGLIAMGMWSGVKRTKKKETEQEREERIFGIDGSENQ